MTNNHKFLNEKIDLKITRDIIINKMSQEEQKLKFIDLFCGIGSFHYSFKPLGWECVMSCDIDKAAKNTYKENYGMMPLDDITKIDVKTIPNHDILCFGLPCQAFSQCGQHKGFEDERGALFFNVMNIIKHRKPNVIILENVQGLLTHDGGNTFQRIKTEFQQENYTLTHKLLKCSDYGLPQMRKRLFVIGVKNETPLVAHIDKFLDLNEYKNETTLTEFLGKNFEKNTAYTIRCGGKNSPIDDRHNWDGYLVDGKEYRLTIDDCLKLQGFGSAFKLSGTNKEQWKQLGNTIPTIFTELIGKNIDKYYKLSYNLT